MRKLIQFTVFLLFITSLLSLIYAGFLFCKTIGFIVLGISLMICSFVLERQL
nr:MAG TPA: Protein of unknown function (DUF1056) [Caudoviricetes sp.]